MTPALLSRYVRAAELTVHALRGDEELVPIGDVGRDRDRPIAQLPGDRLDTVDAPGQ